MYLIKNLAYNNYLYKNTFWMLNAVLITSFNIKKHILVNKRFEFQEHQNKSKILLKDYFKESKDF